jgi:hypothetical protein
MRQRRWRWSGDALFPMLAYTNVLYKIVFLVIKVSIVFSSSWPETDEMSRIKTRNYMWESGSYDTEVIKTYREKLKRFLLLIKDILQSSRMLESTAVSAGRSAGRKENRRDERSVTWNHRRRQRAQSSRAAITWKNTIGKYQVRIIHN